jgi:AcrR family transcriptional regulator
VEVPTLSRRERERLARRQAILDAALAVFADKGYAGATLDEVAERAEFCKGTLYNYFPGGKEEILFALIDDAYDGMVALIETYFDEHPGLPARRLFHGFIARFIGHFFERQAVFALIIKEVQRLMLEDEGQRPPQLFRHRERFVDALAGPIRAAMDDGTLHRHDPRAVAHLLMGNVHGVMMASLCAPEGKSSFPPDPEAGADFITSILFDGLLTPAGRA